MSGPRDASKVIALSGTAQLVPFGPRVCGMRGLSKPGHSVMLAYTLNHVFRGAGSRDQKTSAYLLGFILVTDKAAYEYALAHEALEVFVATRTQLSVYFRVCWHLENCIHSARRALRYVEQLHSTVRPVMPREHWRAIRSHEGLILGVRNLIEHMDDEIASGHSATMDNFVALALSDEGDSAAIGDKVISFERLAMLLDRLNELANILADYHEPDLDAGA